MQRHALHRHLRARPHLDKIGMIDVDAFERGGKTIQRNGQAAACAGTSERSAVAVSRRPAVCQIKVRRSMQRMAKS